MPAPYDIKEILIFQRQQKHCRFLLLKAIADAS
ncbi:unnamed protein product [Victoria cruziana]